MTENQINSTPEEPTIPPAVTPLARTRSNSFPSFDSDETILFTMASEEFNQDDTPGRNQEETFSSARTDLVDPTLGKLLNTLFDIDPHADRPHEILQGLSRHGTRTWPDFIMMPAEDIQTMTRPGRNPTPVSILSIRKLGYLKQLIWDKLEKDPENFEDIKMYNKKEFFDYVNMINLKKRNNAAYNIKTSGLPSIPATSASAKSTGEKKYDTWNRTSSKRVKTNFTVLRQDDQYRIWQSEFEAELDHQKLTYCLDKNFDPTNITCLYERELWKEQQAYLWTIMLHVLKNPLGRACLSAHMKDKDARATFFAHHKMHEESPAKSFSTSTYLSKLNNLSIKTHNGSRVDFIASWFEELRHLNDISADSLSYEMTKGLLLKAVQGDPKLPDVFTTLTETQQKDTDLETLKTTLLHKAALYDGKDVYLKQGASPSVRHSHQTEFLPYDYNNDDLLNLLINRATYSPNPEARLPDSIYDTFDPQDKNGWRRLPESTRIKLSRLIQSKQPASKPPDRKLYFSDSVAATSDITDDSDLVNSIRDLLIHKSRSTTTSSTRSSPPSHPSQNMLPVAKSAKSSPKSSLKSQPSLSSMDPAHPAALLADKPIDLYDKDGRRYGHINPKHLNLCFHKWYTDKDLQIDTQLDDHIRYKVSAQEITRNNSVSLIDRGANGCVAGAECNWIGGPVSPRNVSITGIDNHQLTNVPIGTVGGYSMSNRGPVICIFNEVAYTGRHKTILSSIQLEHYGNAVNDKNPTIGGKGNIETPDGYTFPLSFNSGLAYLKMRKFTPEEYQNLPHVIMTSDKEWDPTIFDTDVDPNSMLSTTSLPQQLHMLPHADYDLQGEYVDTLHQLHSMANNGHVAFTEYVDHDDINPHDSENSTDEDNFHQSQVLQSNFPFWVHHTEYERSGIIDRCVKTGTKHRMNTLLANDSEFITSNSPRIHTPNQKDYESLKPFFAWIPTKMIEATFRNSTQYGYMPTSPDGNLFKRWHAPNPAVNVFRLNDDLMTDKIYSDKEAIDSGHTEAQIFFGRKSHIIHVEPISEKHPFLKCLQNFVRKWGAPLRLLGDHAGNQSSFQVMDYLRMLWIGFWQSEPYYQHQNMFERRYQTFKRTVNRLMDRTGTPGELWYHCMLYVAYVLNRVSDPSLNDRQPIFAATGQIGDISAMLPFHWLEPVYYRANDSQFPSGSNEHFGYWVGVAEHVGHAMTFKIWNKQTKKILHRSSVRSARDSKNHNLRAIGTDDPSLLLPTDCPLPPTDDKMSVPHPIYGIGTIIRKRFEDGNFYNGKVTSYNTPFYHIQYEDGDEEDLDEAEMKQYYTTPPVYSTPSHPPSLRTLTAQDYGEKEPGRPPDTIFSHDQDGIMETTDWAEKAYFYEDADKDVDYLTTPPDRLINDDNQVMVPLIGDDGNPRFDDEGKPLQIKGIDHIALQGKEFLKREDDGTQLRARVLETIEDKREQNKDFSKFKIKYDRTEVEDIMTYNDIMNFIHRDNCDNEDHEWKFRNILSHQGPLDHRHPNYRGSKYNVEVEWENGERTFEPLETIYAGDKVSLALYAKKNNLLNKPGWKRLKRIASRDKKFDRLVKQAKLRSYRTAPKYMYGYQVPRTYDEALELDRRNGNTKWADATSLEMEQLDEYKTFIDMGAFSPNKIPDGFQQIKVHLVFAVKHDGRHKARLVSRGDLTDIPLDSVYAGVVSLRGLRMCIFIAELNGLEAYATDIGNAYLEATTREKVCIKAGPEFGEKEGHLLIIYKALYGLRSSGKEFGELLAACLRELGFFPTKAEPEIFMRENNGIYEYVATYVDDLCLVLREPDKFLKQLQGEPYSFKLKGTGPMSFHLGCGFQRDKTGILSMTPKKYVEKMIQAYEQMFGSKPNPNPQSPLPENDHPELDTTEFLEEEGIQQYQSLIGSLQWAISIGRWDIQTAVMTLSSFRAQPRKGHLERVKRIYGYVSRFKHFELKFRTDEPATGRFNGKIKFDWSKSVYEEHQEEIPHDAPPPLGKRVTLIHYFDANLMHDVLSGKSVTGCIHLANKTPIMWHSKKQATSETATYGAEFSAGRTCIEQVIDLRNTFRYLGVPINETSYVFGDNESMIQSASFPYAKLHKRHNILSFHFVRGMIARGFIALYHIRSENNLADILTKHWSHNSVYNLLRPIFHHVGNTAELYTDDTPGCLDSVLNQ